MLNWKDAYISAFCEGYDKISACGISAFNVKSEILYEMKYCAGITENDIIYQSVEKLLNEHIQDIENIEKQFHIGISKISEKL